MLKNQIIGLGRMPRYAEAIADVIYKGFVLVFGSFFADIWSRLTEKF